MSYVLIRVYSFECDECGELSGDVIPRHGGGLRHATSELRALGWRIRNGQHICPNHTVEEK